MKRKIQSVLCVLAGLVFINAGLNKFFNYMPVPKDLPEKLVAMAKAFMEIGWVMPLVGTFEIIGGLLLLIPRTRPLAAMILTPILVGIFVAHANVAPSGLPLAIALMAIIGWVIVDNKEKYLALIR